MKKFKLFTFIAILFASLFMLVSINKTNATAEIADSAEVTVDAEINQSKTVLRFIVTASGVELKKIDEIELILKKDGVASKKQLFITTVYTSISNASRDYAEADNTYYGIVNITDTKVLSNSTLTANAKITYTDSSIKMMDNDKEINIPDIPTYIREGSTVYFGSYPQTKETNNDVLSNLNSLVGTPEEPLNDANWIDYGYFISNIQTEYMYYIDVDLNNDSKFDYRGVYFNQYRPTAVDQPSNVSKSKQHNNGYDINNVYWFKYEPIKWDVLNIEDGKAMISSSLILDAQQVLCAYGAPGDTINNHNGYNDRYLAAYDASDIRLWLNNNFYNDAFDTCDKRIINETTIDNSYDTIGDIQREILDNSSTINQAALLGTNTKDNVFLLSYDEISTYYSSDERKINTSDYSLCQGVSYNNNNKTADWWTRTPSTTLYESCYTSYAGNQQENNSVLKNAVTLTHGVKPTIYIDIDSFILNVTSNNDLYGSSNLIGESSHSYGESVTLEAIENDGYSFVGWYNNNKLLADTKSCTFFMPNNSYDVEARFTAYTITTSIDDLDAGEITEFDHLNKTAGETINLSIELADGYSFLGWYIGDEFVSDEENFSYTMPNENVQILAKTSKFTLTVDSYLANGYEDSYKVLFDSNGGSKVYSQYSNNLLYSIPTKEGYVFAGWYDNPELSGSTFDFTSEITEDITLYAKWVEKDSNYTYLGQERVNIYSNGANYGDYYVIVPYMDGVLNLYSRFPFQSSSCKYELYNSSFELIDTYDDVDGPGFDYNLHTYNVLAGDVLYIRMKPYNLWYGYDSHYSNVYFNHTVSTTGYDYGSSTRIDNECIKSGTTIKLTATISNGTTFEGWYSGDTLLSNSLKYTFDMPKNSLVIYAKYAYYTLTLVNTAEEAGTISNYNNTKTVVGENVTIEATTNDQYSFLGWYDSNDNLVSPDLKYNFIMPHESITYYAKFKTILVSVTKDTEAAGDVSISDDLAYGQEAKATATVNYGYIFIGWYDGDGNKLTNELEYTFVVGDHNVFEARYIVNQITITESLDEAGSISEFEFGYVLGDTLELTYTAKPGYTWYGWYLNGDLLAEEKTITITITNEVKSYVARAEKYVVNITANIEEAMNDYATITYDTNGGSEVTSQKSYEVTYIIPTKTGNIFVGWYDNALCEGEAYDFNSQIEEDITLYAKWIPTDYAVFPFNVSRYTRIPKGDYEEEEAWYAFYPLTTGEAHLTSNKISSYGYIVRIYAADKETLIASAQNNKENVYIDFKFNVEANNVYYMVLEKAYINAGSYNNIRLEVALPSVTCNTSRNGEIVYAGETVYIYAAAKEGYTFVGWYFNNVLVTKNNYYSFIMGEYSIEYEARYTQNKVTYTVNHYLQNVDDNEYTIVTEDIEIVDGYTGDNTAAEANTYVGFNAKAFDQVKINGDNSTVVNIYYDRIIYDLTTSAVNIINNSDAGSVNIKNGSYKYYKSVTLVATPNTGYGFIGWYNGDNLASCDAEYTFNMPSNDLNLVAKFEALEVDYTVEYWLENANDNNYTLDVTETLSGYSGNTTEAVLKVYGDFNAPVITQKTIAGDGSTVIVLQYKRKTVPMVALEIFFGLYNDNMFGSVNAPEGYTIYSTGYYYDPRRHYSYKEDVKVGSVITPSITPNEGYVLEGWYLNNGERIADSELDTFTYTVTQDDVADNAIWLVAKVTTTYNVRYHYQNNINEWLADNSIDITYDIDSTLYSRSNKELFVLSNETVETLTEIQNGFEVKEIKNIMVNDKNAIIDVYCTPKQYALNVKRVYGGSLVHYGDDYVGDPEQDIMLYYGQTSDLLRAETGSGVTFIGWYIEKNGELYGDPLTTELEYTFTMPCERIMLVPAFSIEYDLEVHKDGVVTHEKRIGNIGYRIVPDVYEGYIPYVRYYSKTITDAHFYVLQDFDPIVVVDYVKED